MKLKKMLILLVFISLVLMNIIDKQSHFTLPLKPLDDWSRQSPDLP